MVASARPGCVEPDTFNVEEFEIAIETALRVNKHLNAEVDRLVRLLSAVEQERDAWKKRANYLKTQLARSKHQEGHELEEQLTHAQEAEDATISNRQQDQLDQLPAEWSSQTSGVASLIEKGKAAGWLVKSSEIQLGEPLGQGAFGVTYKSVWRGSEVAVKCVRISKATELTNFLREIDALSHIRHPHVVPFLGAVLEPPQKCWLISEFMHGGTLARWLHGSPGASAPSRPLLARLRMVYDVAQGMCALEATNPPILHRDLKPTNIFIDDAGHARVGDFGLARRLMPGGSATLTGETGTYLYMSPEMIRHDVYDQKTDVWSFGVLLAEAATARLPYEHLYMTPIQIALAVADETLQPAFPDGLHPNFAVIGAACLDFDPEMRPDFAFITAEMTAALAELKEQTEVQGGVLAMLMRSKALPATWSQVLSRLPVHK